MRLANSVALRGILMPCLSGQLQFRGWGYGLAQPGLSEGIYRDAGSRLRLPTVGNTAQQFPRLLCGAYRCCQLQGAFLTAQDLGYIRSGTWGPMLGQRPAEPGHRETGLRLGLRPHQHDCFHRTEQLVLGSGARCCVSGSSQTSGSRSPVLSLSTTWGWGWRGV